jgi:hypothetical protein
MHTSAEIYLNNGQVSDMVDVFLFFASALLAMIKHIFMNLHRRKIAENLKSYLKDWSDIKDEASLKIMRVHAKVGYQRIVINVCLIIKLIILI